MHQHHIGLRLLEHIIQPMQAFLCNQCQRLPRLHDVKVIIRLDLKNIQHLIQHLAVLRGDADDRLGMGILFQCMHQRRHFDRLRPRAEHSHHFNFVHRLFSPFVRPHHPCLLPLGFHRADACPSVPRRR